MPVETVTLTGSGLMGTLPSQPSAELRRLIRELPKVVKLGRRRHAKPAKCLHLGDYLDRREGAPVPTRVDWFSKSRASIARMYGNDREGCCVISGKAHTLGSWTAHDSDSGGEVLATDQEIHDQYQRWCGPGDNGCYIPDVLERLRTGGLVAAGKAHKIAGWVGVDWRNVEQLKTALHLFGPLSIGFNFPSGWSGSSVWDVENSRIVGGHDVSIMGYDERGLNVASWGRLYLMTWKAMASPRYTEECYALLSPDWTGSDKLAPCGVDVDKLAAALAQLGGGQTPPIPEPGPGPNPPPNPPGPPGPPAPPPATEFTLEGTIQLPRFSGEGTFRGVARPAAPAPTGDTFTFPEVPEAAARGIMDALFPALHLDVTRDRGRITIRRGKLTPEQWTAIVNAVMTIIMMILGSSEPAGAKASPQDRAGDAVAGPDGSGQGGGNGVKGDQEPEEGDQEQPPADDQEQPAEEEEEQPPADDQEQPAEEEEEQPAEEEKPKDDKKPRKGK